MSRNAAKPAGIFRMDLAGESVFGTEPGAGIFTYIRTTGVQINLDRAAAENASQVQVDAPISRIMKRRTGTLVTTHYLHGFSSTDPAASPSADDTETTQAAAHGMDFIRRIIASVVGNHKAPAGVYDATAGLGAGGAPTDTIEMTDISNFAPGDACMWETGDADFPYCCGVLKGIDTSATPNEGTLLQDTPHSDPSAGGDSVWGPYTIFSPAEHLGSDDLDPMHNTGLSGQTNNAVSYSAHLIGLDSDDYYECYGMRPTQVVFRPFADVPETEVTWSVAHWDEPDSGGGPTIGTWSFPEAEDVVGNCWAAWGDAHSDGSQGGSLPLDSLEITIAAERPEQKDPSQPSGVGGWVTTKRTITASMTLYRDVGEEVTYYDDQEIEPFTFQMGSAPGKTWLFCIPGARVTSYPSRGETDGLVTTQVTLSADYYNGDNGDTDGDASDDVSRSDITPFNSHFRIYCF